MPFDTLPARHHTLAIAIVTVALAACGGGDDNSQIATPVATDATTGDQPSGDSGGGQSPFTAAIECLRAEGLDVDEPDLGEPGGTGGPPNRGSRPPDFSVPEGGFPGGSLPDGQFPGGTPREGGLPGGSVPEGGFPEGSRPEGAPSGDGDPTFLVGVLGLDANDPDVAAAIEACSAQPGG